MIQINAFLEMTTVDYDDSVLKRAIVEINSQIKENAVDFRLALEVSYDSTESRLYKNAITHYYMKNGFKIVCYPTLIYIDWAKPHVDQSSMVPITSDSIEELGTHFTAQELYMIITSGKDLRKLSHRVLEHLVLQELKKMVMVDKSKSTISVGLSCTLTGNQLNNMFAPELLKLNTKLEFTSFTFVDGGNLQITADDTPVLYTELPHEVLFGTRT